MHITSDGNTAYLPLVRNDNYTGMGRFYISILILLDRSESTVPRGTKCLQLHHG